MSTRSSTRNLFPPLEDPEHTIRRRTHVDLSLLNNFKEINMAANGAGNDGPPPAGGDGLPVLDLRTMEELCQPTLNGRGGPIAPIAIQATNFGLKNDMIQQANDAILKNMQTNMTTLTNSTNDLKNMLGQFMKMNTASSLGSRTLPSNTITNPREDLKVEQEIEVTKDTVTNNGGTEDVQPPVVQVETQVPNFEPVEAPVSALNPNLKPSIPYPSRLNEQKLREKANNQMEKFFQIFQDLHFDISFVDALMILLKKLHEKLRDPSKFLIPCDFPGMDVCLALADLGVEFLGAIPINLKCTCGSR
ncbi:hypothetical protein Tco_0323407 [Tanacetum coccineum]